MFSMMGDESQCPANSRLWLVNGSRRSGSRPCTVNTGRSERILNGSSAAYDLLAGCKAPENAQPTSFMCAGNIEKNIQMMVARYGIAIYTFEGTFLRIVIRANGSKSAHPANPGRK